MKIKQDNHSPNVLLDKFHTLFFPLMNRLYATALRLTRDRWDAEDLVQETYMKAWRHFNQFKLGSNSRAWIFTILYNNFLSFYNSKKRTPFMRDLDISHKALRTEPNQLRSFEEAYEAGDYTDIFDDTISSALDRLPFHYRLPVLLSDIEELPYKDIAAVLGCPIGTVMSRISRGRKALARNLKRHARSYGIKSSSVVISN